MHLTNYSINKNSEKFRNDDNGKLNSEFKKEFESIWEEVEKVGGSREIVFDEIKKCCIKTICAVQPQLSNLYTAGQAEDITGFMCFEILGFDVILDQNLKPYVLEVNHAPSFNTDTELDFNVKNELIHSLIDILSVNIQQRNEKII